MMAYYAKVDVAMLARVAQPLAGGRVMLTQDFARYVDLHRSLGFKFRSQRLLLRNFVAFAEHAGDTWAHASRALEWSAQAPSPSQQHNRIATLRRFALAMRAEDPRHEVLAVLRGDGVHAACRCGRNQPRLCEPGSRCAIRPRRRSYF